ncbi:MAG: hypothetical protein L6R42_006995 [Xanthoria sp. 1 TBL-2021]|nr:MAG: hypothetical protein L6R42_006995 [Xanthoria sp. 1 TBL-2021]
MPRRKKLTSRLSKTQGISDAEKATLVQVTFDNFPRQTRATARIIKQNALEAGLIQPETKPKPRKPVLVTRIVSSGSEDSDSELEFTFESDRKAMNPWRQVSQSESARAWSAWNAEQGLLVVWQGIQKVGIWSIENLLDVLPKHSQSSRLTFAIDSLDQLLRSPNYVVGSTKPPCPILMKDLVSRADTYEVDSPATFEPDVRQWRAFDVLISHLQEHANGREDGFVKVKVPKYDDMTSPS